MLTTLTKKPDYIVLSLIALSIAMFAAPYADQFDFSFDLVPSMSTIETRMN